MKVISHQNISQEPHAALLAPFGEKREKRLSIRVVLEDYLMRSASCHHMIKATLRYFSGCPGHIRLPLDGFRETR